ncbi:hypothetical protein C8R47DRAFT_1208342 [Mycena vitilis]|nr:hypothetical protein C8R47DRAFT_1208342 [Mycena vitilis]
MDGRKRGHTPSAWQAHHPLIADDDDLADVLEDDSDVPLQHVIREALGLDVADVPGTSGFCVASAAVTAGTDGSLSAGGDAENIWAYNGNGIAWRDGNLATETFL